MEQTTKPKRQGRGKSKSAYRYKVVDKRTGELYHCITADEIEKKLGIPESSVYWMMRQENNSSKKWENFAIFRCNIPIYKQVKVVLF